MSIAKPSIIRFRRLFWMGALAIALMILLLAATGQKTITQANGDKEIGLGRPGSNAYQFAGHIDQDGAKFIGYGYLYDVEGLTPDKLFSDPSSPSESTARFTYYATATLTSRAVVTDAVRAIFALDSVGAITYYYQSTPSASFDDPASFAKGTPISTASVQFQDILSVQGPNRGISVGNGDFSFLSVDSFEFEGETLRFGRPGLVYRISTFGDGLRTDPIIPRSSVLLAGNAVMPGFWQTFVPSVFGQGGP